MKDEPIYAVSFAAKDISINVEKAKLKCEILMTEILLKRLRRDLNKILKEIRHEKLKLPYTASEHPKLKFAKDGGCLVCGKKEHTDAELMKCYLVVNSTSFQTACLNGVENDSGNKASESAPSND